MSSCVLGCLGFAFPVPCPQPGSVFMELLDSHFPPVASVCTKHQA
jgi:hypothetical protein